MSQWIEPVTLENAHVRLEPLAAAHAGGLAGAVADGELWRLWFTNAPAPGDVPAFIDTALGQAANGEGQTFAVRRLEDDCIVGTTRYMRADSANRRVEIGSTWYAAGAQRSAVNTSCKRLLLGHAFEQLGCIAVELRTHRLNRRSRAAIERLGAQLDGVLRNHRVLADGTYRDTAVYSIIETEWPVVRRHLDHRLESGA